MGSAHAPWLGMYVSFDREQTATLLEILQSTLKQVRIESSHTDSRDFRAMLSHREEVLESVLAKLSNEPLS